MIAKSISNPDIFKIIDERDNKTHFGFDQKWYPSKWQRLSGCGPTVVCNLFFYSRNIKPDNNYNSRNTLLSLMEDVWKYVTPTINGIPTTKMFYDSVLSYAESKGMDIKYEVLDLPKARSARPQLSEVMMFLDRALSQDAPIAFLNLNKGKENNLDSWHWVTIISLEYEADGSYAFINILDEGTVKKINLELWYKTTTLGGGFVYFTPLLEEKTMNYEKPKVAFVCVHNSCRSQIAEALSKKFASDVYDSLSAGTEIKPKIDQDAVRLMKQVYGIDMEKDQYSKRLSDIPAIDILITMGCNVECPFVPNKHREDWGLDDPTGKDDAEFLKTMALIEEKVRQLRQRIIDKELSSV